MARFSSSRVSTQFILYSLAILLGMISLGAILLVWITDALGLGWGLNPGQAGGAFSLQNIAWGLGILVALGAMTYLFHRSIRRWILEPIRKVAEADEALAEGKDIKAYEVGNFAETTTVQRLVRSRSALARRLRLAEQLGQLMTLERDASRVKEQVLVLLMEALQSDRGTLWILSAAGGYFLAEAEVQPPDDPASPMIGLRLSPGSDPFLKSLLARAEPILASQLDESIPDTSLLVKLEAADFILVPLVHWGGLIGFILLGRKSQAPTYRRADLPLARLASSLVAGIVEDLRHRDVELARGRRMAALAELSATLTARHRLADVLKEVVAHGRALGRSATCSVLMVDEQNGRLRLAEQVGLGHSGASAEIPLEHPVVRRFVHEAKPLLLDGVNKDLQEVPEIVVRDDLLSLHMFPLKADGRVFGALTLGYVDRYHPEEAELRISEALASVAAAAIQNARAFEEEAQQRSLLTTVAEISRRVSGILDTEWMLQEVCSLLSLELGYEFVHAFLTDSTGRDLLYVAGAAPSGPIARSSDALVPVDNRSLVGSAAKRGEPRRRGSPVPDLFRESIDILSNVRSEIALPIVAHGRVMGMLDIQSTKPRAFSLEDQRVLKIVADQLSVALDNARHHAQVQAQARLDSLTQVLNHGAFIAALYALVDRGKQESLPLSLIMLDVDYFKAYNDHYGHVAGDAALRTTVQAIQANIKKRDVVGRWGGEEFGVVLVGASKDQARMVAERIRQTLASLVPVDRLGREMPPPSVSQGIATLGEDANDADTLVDIADQALYRAKSAGRDQVRIAGRV